MIEINLLPEELKTKAKKFSVGIQSKYALYFIPLLLCLLIAVHIYLLILNISGNYKLSQLSNKWQGLQPQRKILDSTKEEYDTLSADALVIQQLTNQRINWSEKLNRLSLNLPSGVWFNEISLLNKGFTLKGSVVSLQKEEMGLINKFLTNLKNDAGFFRDFNNLELSSVQRRVIGGYEIVDFVIIGTFKSE